MSAFTVFSSAATGRPFIFSLPSSPPSNVEKGAQKVAEILAHVRATPKLAAVLPASRLDARPVPEMVSSGIPQLDALTGGLARGCLTEICGTASSGRTSVLLSTLARATQRGDVCALVDTSDAFNPASAVAAGMEMSRLLWVRCGDKYPLRKNKNKDTDGDHIGIAPPAGKRVSFHDWQSQLGQMLKVTDLLLQSNGFGMIALDLGDVPVQSARRIPLASWFRFRRAIEHTATAMLVVEQQPIAGSCSSMLLRLSGTRSQRSGKTLSAANSQLSGNLAVDSGLPHAELFDHFEITAELLCSRLDTNLERKPVQSTASFKSRAAWVG